MQNDSNTPSTERAEMRNEAHSVPEVTDQALRSLRDLQMETLHQYQQRSAAVRGGSRNEQRLQAKLRKQFAKDIPGLKQLGAAVLTDHRSNLDLALGRFKLPPGIFDVKPPDVGPPPPPPVTDGTFWWANTDYHWGRGIQASFLTDGLHFFGAAAYHADPLISFSVGAVAHFELHSRRRPPSSSGRYASAPIVELFGKVEGFTGYWHWLAAADDKWAKCWLHLRQTALQLVPHDYGAPGLHHVEQPVVIAERIERRTLIDEENNGSWVNSFLPGFLPMPPIEFGLVDPNLSIWVQLEIRFDMQLEGWSHLAFSPEPNPMGSVLLRHPQWQIQTL